MTTGSGDRVDLIGIIVVSIELHAFAGTCGSHTAKILFSCTVRFTNLLLYFNQVSNFEVTLVTNVVAPEIIAQ